MSRYVVRVVQRDGNPWYVLLSAKLGDRLSDWDINATHFADAAAALRVADEWRAQFAAGEAYIDVIDMDDPEKGSL
jgi:hypothetical protein